MNLRVLGGGAGILYLLLIIVALSSDPSSEDQLVNRLGNRPGMADRLMMFDSAQDWGKGEMKFARVAADAVLLSGDGEKDYPKQGSWTSPEIRLQMPSTEFIPSWNGSVPVNGGVRLELRTARRGDWSPWFYFGSWGKVPRTMEKVTSFDDGEVYIDNLILERAATAMQVRVQLFSYDLERDVSPQIRRIAVSYSGYAPEMAEADLGAIKLEKAQWARDLKVPFRTQKDAPAALANQICSPTSVSMVMQYWGVNRPTIENALAIYDGEYDLFGNWARAVERAGELGLEGWVERFRNWEKVKEQIAKGQPVIASIAFKKGEFDSAVISRTNGHLIVIRGFTSDGDVIVN
ncbi:MAG TPA: C39 family peptidase, partial [Tepidisphaeraceae bacterium]|nr:C39 family peptidase [Tepidisphaeraceae bacterium]